MREGWEVKTLGEVSSIKYGYTAKASFDAIGPKFLRITDIQDGDVDWDAVPSCPISASDAEKYRVETGDIVFARTGATTGKSYLIDCPPNSVAASYLIRLRLLDGRILPSFVAYFFHTSEYWDAVNAGTSGSAQGGFNASKLGCLSVPLPPLAEQKRIVALLDEALAGIAVALAAASKNLKNARELFETTLNATFTQKGEGWVQEPLANFLNKITYGFTNPMPTTEVGPFLVTAKNVRGGIIDYENARHTSQEAFDNLITAKSRPIAGDVLLTKDGTLGRLAVVERDGLCVNQSVAVLRPNERILPFFLKTLLSSPNYQKLMIADAGGTTIKHIYITRVDKMVIVVPSVEAQQKVIDRLEFYSTQTERLEALYQQKIETLNELKQSLLQKAFAGELTAEVQPLEATG